MVAIGDGFVQGLAGEYVVENFPAVLRREDRWSEPDQNFIVTGVDIGAGFETVGENSPSTSATATYPERRRGRGAHHKAPAQIASRAAWG